MECWRTIDGTEGAYEVSDQGRIRSLVGTEPRVLRQQPYKGYPTVMLRTIGKRCSVHRLVLTAFRGVCPPDAEGSHLNGKRDDNRLDNLVWEDRVSNVQRKHEHGTMYRPSGTAAPSVKLSDDDVRAIRRAVARREATQKSLARHYGVSPAAVSLLVNRRTWAHIT